MKYLFKFVNTNLLHPISPSVRQESGLRIRNSLSDTLWCVKCDVWVCWPFEVLHVIYERQPWTIWLPETACQTIASGHKTVGQVFLASWNQSNAYKKFNGNGGGPEQIAT